MTAFDPKPKAYCDFLDFVGSMNQLERSVTNRRMFSVFFWCFFAPAIASIIIALLINSGVLPRTARSYLDWIVLIFPVLYSLYFLGSQVLTGIPTAFRQGGFAMTLSQAKKESEWRTDICHRMVNELKFDSRDWAWIVFNVNVDLERMQMRTRFLTALGGAVFFLIMQGIDSITTPADANAASLFVPNAKLGGVIQYQFGGSADWVGLSLFLLLLYLTGQQTYHGLKRYATCAEWLNIKFSELDRRVTLPSV